MEELLETMITEKVHAFEAMEAKVKKATTGFLSSQELSKLTTLGIEYAAARSAMMTLYELKGWLHR